MVGFLSLREMTFFLLKVLFLSSNVCSDFLLYFISGLYQLMKEIGCLCCEPLGQPVTVVAVVSFEGLPETTYFFVLMVRFSFIEGVF
jgi:hypothetical protein